MSDEEPMESWRKIFREGLAPLLSIQELNALHKGLTEDDPKLIQGATTTPPPLQCVENWPCEAACLIGYPLWKGQELPTVGEVEDAFARCCYSIDNAMGEPAACRWLLNWFDDEPRASMIANLLPEVERELQKRKD